jgi:hypothetical protein
MKNRGHSGSPMNRVRDPILLALIGLLALSLGSWFADLIPYPFGLLILVVFIVARLHYANRIRKNPR